MQLDPIYIIPKWSSFLQPPSTGCIIGSNQYFKPYTDAKIEAKFINPGLVRKWEDTG